MRKLVKLGLFTPIFLIALGFALGAILIPYVLNTWLIYFGKDPVVKWWMGGLLGFIPAIGEAAIPAAIITWVIMLFI